MVNEGDKKAAPPVTVARDASHPAHWTDWFFYPAEGSNHLLSPSARWANFAAAALLIALVLVIPFLLLNIQWNWAPIWKYRQKFIDGYLLTLVISCASLVLSTVLGVLSALAGRARFLPLRYVNRIYIDLVRGTPLLVQILILYYVTANAMRINDRNLCGVLILSFSYGAYISEIIRGGIESIGKSQLESAKAIGLTMVQTYRYVIFPQAIRQVTPSLAGQLVSLIKDSALLSTISIGEFTLNGKETGNIALSVMECYIVLAVGYLILTLPISLLTRFLEKRTRFET